MITEITLENVKSIKDITSINLAPVTLFIGENGSGKSTFIQMLSLLSQNPSSPSLEDGQIVSLGSFNQLANDPQKPILIQLKGNITLDVDDFAYMKNLDYALALRYHPDRTNVIGEVFCNLTTKVNDFMKVKLGLSSDTVFFNVHWKPSFGIITFQHIFYNLKTDSKNTITVQFQPPFHFSVQQWAPNPPPDQDQRESITRFLNAMTRKMIEELENVSYVPALRGIDSRNQQLQANISRHPINAFNFNNQSQLLASSLAYNRDLEGKISSLIESILDRKCRGRVQQGLLVAVEAYNGSKWVNIMNEGFGTNPLVQLAYQLVSAPKNSMVLIEEPEIHVFPAAQKRMIVQLVRFAKSENKRLVITTHSPHVYSVLLKYKESNDSDVKMYYFKRSSETKVSAITEITSSNRSGMLNEFLSTDIDEVANIIEAGGV